MHSLKNIYTYYLLFFIYCTIFGSLTSINSFFYKIDCSYKTSKHRINFEDIKIIKKETHYSVILTNHEYSHMFLRERGLSHEWESGKLRMISVSKINFYGQWRKSWADLSPALVRGIIRWQGCLDCGGKRSWGWGMV